MKRAFTLVEIMIVIAIVVVLITIAIPNILRSRVAANEGVTIANLRTLNNACQQFHINEQRYPDNLSDLSLAQPPYIDKVLGGGSKQGYQFTYTSIDSDHFTINADPAHSGLLKGRYFYLNESGTIRVRSDGQAGPDDEIVG
jgi:prepilin-type N-terminal cleavage/methylation domain-containing protein